MSQDEILTYMEMCVREGLSLQRGMNHRQPPAISIVLMSRRPGALYEDSLSADGLELVYEGHDTPKSNGVNPKSVDQPWTLTGDRKTDNARFADMAGRPDAFVRVYEKLKQGIWSDRGLFLLSSYEYIPSGGRHVFKFHMRLTDEPDEAVKAPIINLPVNRAIPSSVKQIVYKRDKGRCVLCGAEDNLHFDHEVPFSRGGSSLTPENVRILCARHNLVKGARIE